MSDAYIVRRGGAVPEPPKEMYLIKNGSRVSDYGSLSQAHVNHYSISMSVSYPNPVTVSMNGWGDGNSQGIVKTPGIDLTNWKVVHARFRQATSTDDLAPKFGIWNSGWGFYASTSLSNNSSYQTVSVDISSISGNKPIGFYVMGERTNHGNILYITDLWLSR